MGDVSWLYIIIVLAASAISFMVGCHIRPQLLAKLFTLMTLGAITHTLMSATIKRREEEIVELKLRLARTGESR